MKANKILLHLYTTNFIYYLFTLLVISFLKNLNLQSGGSYIYRVQKLS